MPDPQRFADLGADPLDGAGWGPPARVGRRLRLVAPVVLSLLIQVPAAVWITLRTAPHVPHWPVVLHIVLAAAGPLALLALRRLPGPTVAVVAAFALLDVLTTPVGGPPYIALAFAVIGAVARGAIVWAAISVGVGWASAILIGTLIDRTWFPGVVVAATVALAACFAIGTGLRSRGARRAAMHAEIQHRRRSAEEQERVRIARELHDVLGHALSQMNVQAGVGLHLFDRDPEQARAALQNVKDTSKLALEEVRGVLGVLRDGEVPLVPQAELAELPRLIAGITAPGLEVVLDDRLEGQVPGRAAQFAAYRIVQEALTNVVRHADATHARVVLDRREASLIVTVSDDGAGFGGVDPATAGHGGVLGMRERAELLGGSIRFSDRLGGGAEVVAELPWGRTS